jgi:uncharacterized protein DUF6079
VKYGQLIQFEPIERVKVLREADAADVARADVSTFVISAHMAEQLTEIIFPNLQFDEPAPRRREALRAPPLHDLVGIAPRPPHALPPSNVRVTTRS